MTRGGLAAYVAAGAAALAAGVWVGTRAPGPAPAVATSGYVLDQPRRPAAFELVDERGRPFGRTQLEDGWSLLYFGFTFCPDVCPAAMLELAELKSRLAARLDGPPPRVFLVSVDPRRDTPERLREYVGYFDAEFRALTGREGEIAKLAQAAAVVYRVPDAPADPEYLVDHSSTVTLVNPRGEVHAIFTEPFDGARLAADVERIVAAWPGRG